VRTLIIGQQGERFLGYRAQGVGFQAAAAVNRRLIANPGDLSQGMNAPAIGGAWASVRIDNRSERRPSGETTPELG
jgi:hypothetical protein